MTDFSTMRVSVANFEGFWRSLMTVIQALPPEVRRRLHDIRCNYLASYGFEGTYQRMNDRTVAQIFAEYQPGDVNVIASGVVDGVRYQLSEPPPSHTTHTERGADE